jgi:uncharacterized protein (TIGR03083 family)
VIDPRPLFGPLHHGLLTLLQSLEEDEWWRPTVCGEWTVHDLAIHLYGADVNVLAGDRDHFRHPLVAPPDADLSDWDQLLAFIDGRNAAWVEVNRRLSPRLLIELIECTGHLVNEFWPTLEMNSPGNPVNWVGPDVQPVWVHVVREYTERWIHQQQLRDAVGKPGLTSERFLRPVIDAFALALPRALSNVDAASADEVHLVVTGEGGGTWYVKYDGSAWISARENRCPPRATISMPAESFWRMVSRTIGPAQARKSAVETGDPACTAAIFGMVSMIVG